MIEISELYPTKKREGDTRDATISQLRDRFISRWVLKRLSREKESK